MRGVAAIHGECVADHETCARTAEPQDGRPRSFRTSFERRKIELRTWKPKFRLIGKEPSAQEWFHKIYTEVEERFIRRPEEKRRSTSGAPTDGGRKEA